MNHVSAEVKRQSQKIFALPGCATCITASRSRDFIRAHPRNPWLN
jgi:hypothetical protein